MALYVCVFHKFDVAVVDIVSLPILVFALFRKPVLFYCHYPDKLLATTLCPGSNQSPLKRAYRIAVDGLEALSLGFSSAICCNSRFTCRAFASTFPTLRRPNVIYPCVNIPDVNTPELRRPARLLVSLNRYERKKNIALAIETLGTLVEQRGHEVDDLKLIIAGGYDSRLQENVEHFEELERLVADRGLAERVTLRRNVSNEERRNMLRSALAILYTPSNEHFGIVPLEAMAEGIPVVAVNNGGPVESIENNVSGVLCESSADAFAQALGPFLENQQSSITMGLRGRERVQKYFSRAVLGSELQNALVRLVIP